AQPRERGSAEARRLAGLLAEAEASVAANARLGGVGCLGSLGSGAAGGERRG
ncbi:unnamed protein product, partial [Effrenium voratum]